MLTIKMTIVVHSPCSQRVIPNISEDEIMTLDVGLMLGGCHTNIGSMSCLCWDGF